MDGERVVRELITVLPEAFTGSEPDGEYMAMGEARRWVEDRALKIRWGGRVAGVRPDAEAPLTRFLGYVEQLVASGDDDAHTLVFVELLEGAVWAEQIADRLGPQTRALVQSGRSDT